MAQEYKIATIADFLALTPEQRVRCAVDLVAWAAFIDSVRAAAPGEFQEAIECIWVDDGRTGEVSAVDLSDLDGKHLHRFDFPPAGEGQA